MIIAARMSVLGVLAAASVAGLAAAASAAPGERSSTRVEAPHTRVETGRRVGVDAPYAFVRVDRKTGRVVVRAPFANIDVPRR